MQFSFNLSRNGVARQVAGRFQGVTCPLSNLSRNFLALQRLHTMQLFLQIVSRCWKKKSTASCQRHVTRCNLELQLAVVSRIHVLVVESRTEFYFVWSLKAQESCETNCKENLSRNTQSTPLQHRLQRNCTV